MLPPDTAIRERMLWAGLAAFVGILHDGPEVGTSQRLFQRIEAACQFFGVYGPDADKVAKLLGFHYHRASDCYVDRATWEEMTLQDAKPVPGAHLH